MNVSVPIAEIRISTETTRAVTKHSKRACLILFSLCVCVCVSWFQSHKLAFEIRLKTPTEIHDRH